jgi:hypothetical protein
MSPAPGLPGLFRFGFFAETQAIQHKHLMCLYLP